MITKKLTDEMWTWLVAHEPRLLLHDEQVGLRVDALANLIGDVRSTGLDEFLDLVRFRVTERVDDRTVIPARVGRE